MSFFAELKRRNVFRVAAAYIVSAWLVIQVVATVVPMLELPVSLQRLTLIALIIGFPVAVILAWIYELGPHGLQKDSGVTAAGFGRKTDFVIIGVLVVALILSLLTRPSIDDHVDSSIAVLPFANMSGDPRNDPFAAGIHDDLLTQLSRIRSIRTVSRTSTLQYAGTTKPIPEIAAEQNVATILEGGVQRSGDRLRINVQLIRADRDEHLWAETYDRELSASNVFEIQSEIARAIAEALRATLSEDDERRLAFVPTNNIDALDRYFVGRQLLEKRTVESLQAAIEYFRQVTELDPDFALGWSGLADAYMLMPEYSSTADREIVGREASAAIDRALSLDPNLPEVKASRAWYKLRLYKWEEAEAIFREALEIYPDNVNALHWMSHVLSFQGRFDEALVYARHALTVEPDSRMMHTNLAYILTDARRFDEAFELVQQMRREHPAYTVLRRNHFLHQLRAGMPAAAADTYVGFVEAAGGDPVAARQIGDMFIAWSERGQAGNISGDLIERAQLGSEDLAQVLAAVGDAEGAIQALQVALPEHSGSRSVFSMKINPLYDFFRNDPRFREMLVAAGLAD
jgi:TolB-like protein/Tfp pilus assembly protein PilF